MRVICVGGNELVKLDKGSREFYMGKELQNAEKNI